MYLKISVKKAYLDILLPIYLLRYWSENENERVFYHLLTYR